MNSCFVAHKQEGFSSWKWLNVRNIAQGELFPLYIQPSRPQNQVVTVLLTCDLPGMAWRWKPRVEILVHQLTAVKEQNVDKSNINWMWGSKNSRVNINTELFSLLSVEKYSGASWHHGRFPCCFTTSQGEVFVCLFVCRSRVPLRWSSIGKLPRQLSSWENLDGENEGGLSSRRYHGQSANVSRESRGHTCSSCLLFSPGLSAAVCQPISCTWNVNHHVQFRKICNRKEADKESIKPTASSYHRSSKSLIKFLT